MTERRAPTHYDVLGLRPGATPDAIRRAWLRQVRDVHPDRGGSAAAFDAVQRAYDTLRDPAARAEYDRSLHAGHGPQTPPQPGQRRQPSRSHPTSPVQEPLRPVRRVVLPDHTVPPLDERLVPARSVPECVLWWFSVTALAAVVVIGWWLDEPGMVGPTVTVAVVLGLGIGTSRSGQGVGFLTVSWSLATLVTFAVGPVVLGALVLPGEQPAEPMVTVVSVLMVGGTLGTSWAATLTRRRRAAATRVRQRYAHFVAGLDERRRRAEWWVPIEEARQRSGAALWWIWFAAVLPGAGVTSVLLDSPDRARRVPALLWGQWPEATWVVVDAVTGQVLASAPDAARAAWIDLWADPQPVFLG
jgi:hypothetical protein